MNPPIDKLICSFCGLSSAEVDVMLHANGTPYICDQCVDLAIEIVAAARHKKEISRQTMVSATANFPCGSMGEDPGDDRWYKVNAPVANSLYDEHLAELRKEGLTNG